MESWASPSQGPALKYENSPAESLLSGPSDMYPSLFDAEPSSSMNPLEILTPRSYGDKDLESTPTPAPEDDDEGAVSTDKKAPKKRKSWGQVLPEPKTNLPPRKRAKTEDEKEQRRVERVLRNRRAAQSSRERKRLEVEALERRNKELETKLMQAEKNNQLLFQMIQNVQREHGVNAPTDSLRPHAVATFSHELFSSQAKSSSLMDDLLVAQPDKTVNPASISPAHSPIAEDGENDADINNDEENDGAEPASAVDPAPAAETIPPPPATSDETRHPAVSVGSDATGVDGLDGAAELGVGSLPAALSAADLSLGCIDGLPSALDTDSFLYESGLLSSPQSVDLEYDHLAGDSAFPLHNFDIDEFLNHDDGLFPNGGLSLTPGNGLGGPAAAEQPASHDSETQNSPQDPNLQPLPGASSFGCDDGGIAVSGV